MSRPCTNPVEVAPGIPVCRSCVHLLTEHDDEHCCAVCASIYYEVVQAWARGEGNPPPYRMRRSGHKVVPE